MVKLVERITTTIKNTISKFIPDITSGLLSSVKETLSEKGRGALLEMKETVNELLGFSFGGVQKEMDNYVATHSPVEPVDAAREASTMSTAAATSLGIAGAVGIVSEGVSLGQIDKVTDAFNHAFVMMGLGTVLAATLKVPYKWGVDIGHNYWWANKFKPMIPPAPDIINMVVREAFDPDLSAKLLEKYPTPVEFINFMGFQGYSRDWSDKYWMAHFIPMPVTQAERALHRGYIDQKQFSEFLKIADYNPVWHDLMTKVAYRTWRIRDMRIGWELGILDDEKLKKRLTDYGYNPEDVEDIMNVMKAYALAAETGEVRREIISDYTNGFIDESTLKENIKALGTPDSVAEFYVQKATLRRDRDLKKLQADTILDSFKKGIIAQEEAEGSLRELGLSQEWITAHVDNVIANRGVSGDQVSVLTTAQVLRAYKVKVIEESEVKERLTLKGYIDRDIDILIEINRPAV